MFQSFSLVYEHADKQYFPCSGSRESLVFFKPFGYRMFDASSSEWVRTQPRYVEPVALGGKSNIAYFLRTSFHGPRSLKKQHNIQ